MTLNLAIDPILETSIILNYGKALQLFHEADQKGNSSSAYYLGMMFENGLGTPKDLKVAHAWYSKSSQNGYALEREKMKRLSR